MMFVHDAWVHRRWSRSVWRSLLVSVVVSSIALELTLLVLGLGALVSGLYDVP
jgi:hypothetical protein